MDVHSQYQPKKQNRNVRLSIIVYNRNYDWTKEEKKFDLWASNRKLRWINKYNNNKSVCLSVYNIDTLENFLGK